MIATTLDTMFCEHCLTAQPENQFRRRTRGETARLNQCRVCHNTYERLRRADQLREQSDKSISAFTTKLKNAKDHDRVALLCSIMVQHFGGVGGFVAA